MEYQTSDAAPGDLFREQHDSSTAPVQFQRTGVHHSSSPVSPQGIFVAKLKKQQTCRKAGRTEMCLSCKNPKLKSTVTLRMTGDPPNTIELERF